jgi:hypothetical protein
MLFDEQNKHFPSETLEKTSDDLTLMKIYCPDTYRSTKVVYFVDCNGDHFGQFKTEAEARTKFEFMRTIPADQRNQYDQ